MNGSRSMNTYFVLNKKDRLGTMQSRLFHLVLAEMKRKEIEKIKESATLKHESVENSSPIENGFDQLINPDNSKSTEIPLSVQIDNVENGELHFAQKSTLEHKFSTDQSTKTSEVISHPRHSIKSFQRQSHSRTCELL